MKRSRSSAALLLLFVFLFTFDSGASIHFTISPPAGVRHPAASLSAAVVTLQPSHSRPNDGNLRERIIRQLAVPDTATLILAGGIFLLFVEFNLPGAILPGAVGLFLVLSATFGFALHPLRPAALIVLAVAGALLLLSAKSPLPVLNAFAGTAGLISGFYTLVPPAGAPASVHLPVAIAVGLVIGPAAFFLVLIAERAHRNKVVLAASPQASATNSQN